MSGDQLTTRIILARHGEAAYPSDGETGGILTDLGCEQARVLGNTLRHREVAAVVSSELSRAKQTAQIVADILDLEVDVRSGLHEYQLGEEPYSVEAIGRTFLRWLAGDLGARVLGGESGDDILKRVLPVLDDLVQTHEGKAVLVVIHGGAIIATMGGVVPGRSGLPSADNPSNLDRDLVGGAHFCLEHRSGTWRIVPPTSHDRGRTA